VLTEELKGMTIKVSNREESSVRLHDILEPPKLPGQPTKLTDYATTSSSSASTTESHKDSDHAAAEDPCD
jgi:hypothetical protein